MSMDNEYVQKLVAVRLNAMPPDISFSVGKFGDFSRDQLIHEVMRNSEVGKATIRMELDYLKETTQIAGKLSK